MEKCKYGMNKYIFAANNLTVIGGRGLVSRLQILDCSPNYKWSLPFPVISVPISDGESSPTWSPPTHSSQRREVSLGCPAWSQCQGSPPGTTATSGRKTNMGRCQSRDKTVLCSSGRFRPNSDTTHSIISKKNAKNWPYIVGLQMELQWWGSYISFLWMYHCKTL